MEQYGTGTTTLKLRGITLKQYSDKELTFEITPAELIPVLQTLQNKQGKVKGRISPLQTPTEHISHLAFAVLPTKNIEDND
jgi:hypothetical protein